MIGKLFGKVSSLRAVEDVETLLAKALTGVDNLPVGGKADYELRSALKQLERHQPAFGDVRRNLDYLNGDRRFTYVKHPKPEHERFMHSLNPHSVDTLRTALHQIHEQGHSPYLQRFTSAAFAPTTPR